MFLTFCALISKFLPGISSLLKRPFSDLKNFCSAIQLMIFVINVEFAFMSGLATIDSLDVALIVTLSCASLLNICRLVAAFVFAHAEDVALKELFLASYRHALHDSSSTVLLFLIISPWIDGPSLRIAKQLLLWNSLGLHTVLPFSLYAIYMIWNPSLVKKLLQEAYFSVKSDACHSNSHVAMQTVTIGLVSILWPAFLHLTKPFLLHFEIDYSIILCSNVWLKVVLTLCITKAMWTLSVAAATGVSKDASSPCSPRDQLDRFLRKSESADSCIRFENSLVQADMNFDSPLFLISSADRKTTLSRSNEQCLALLRDQHGPSQLTDDEILNLLSDKLINAYDLEKKLGSHIRGVYLRRLWLEKLMKTRLAEDLPFLSYDYSYVTGSCCENVIGYVPVPVGYVGPLRVNGESYFVPMATTEGCLVASTNRGCRAVNAGGGVVSFVHKDGMTRAPVVRLPSVQEAVELKHWLSDPANFKIIKNLFDGTSRFAKLLNIKCAIAARLVYLRFVASTGDAMGMNMVSKGVETALVWIQTTKFSKMEIMSLSGNYCTDKKSAAINWVDGRGKSVISEATIPASAVKNILKTKTSRLLDLYSAKNLIGSAMAGSIGGNNAHSANIVTAVFLATGQDSAQNISSSNCLTHMESRGEDLYISCTMPSLEVGTVGGGTVLPPQQACLQMLRCAGGNRLRPGANAEKLANIICATVLAGELSLMAALCSGDLVKSHLRYNRSKDNLLSLNEPGAVPQSPSPVSEGGPSLVTLVGDAVATGIKTFESGSCTQL